MNAPDPVLVNASSLETGGVHRLAFAVLPRMGGLIRDTLKVTAETAAIIASCKATGISTTVQYVVGEDKNKKFTKECLQNHSVREYASFGSQCST